MLTNNSGLANQQWPWFKAASLSERIAVGKPAIFSDEFDKNQAARRLDRWRNRTFGKNPDLFVRRLAHSGLTEADLQELLAESSQSLQSRFSAKPAWVLGLTEAFSSSYSLQDTLLPSSEEFDPKLQGFLVPVRPLIGQARLRLRQGIANLIENSASLPFDPPNIENLLLEGLDLQIVNLIRPTLVFEMQIARLSGELSSSTPEERFEDFIKKLAQPGASLVLLQEYCVLARRLYTLLENRVNYSLEFLAHLLADWQTLTATFSLGKFPGKITQIAFDLGDSHCQGRSVLGVKFASGLKLVYKPHSLAVDAHFQELLNWLNQWVTYAPFRTFKVVNRLTYGWAEFVEFAACTHSEEVELFYYRTGGLLAVLYALSATDVHHDNLIAAGEYPMLVDLEALFHPILEPANSSEANIIAAQTLDYSVTRVGLLPQRMWMNKDSAGVELSGLGGEAGQLSPQPLPTWEGVGTDEMRLIYKKVIIPVGKNQPTFQEKPVNPLDFSKSILAGFNATYRLLVEQRPALLAKGGPLENFLYDPVRVVLRSTRFYEVLLEKSLHPDNLRDALDQDSLFDKLWYNFKEGSPFTRVISSESSDLHRGDYPYFSTAPGSTDLWDSTGYLIENFFIEPSFENVKRRLNLLGEADLAKQVWFIKASLTILATSPEIQTEPVLYPVNLPDAKIASREQLLKEASLIGDRLEQLALRSTHDISWVGLSVENIDKWYLTPLNMTLYDGLPGVTLFLAYLGACTGEERYTDLARAALFSLRRLVKLNRPAFESVGSFEGWGGVIYTLSHLGVIWKEPALVAEAFELVNLLPSLIEKDEYLDLITGVAGCLGVLLSLYQLQPDRSILAIARKCGDRLVERARPQAVGLAWHTHMPVSQAALGLGRGSTGMAWALLKLAALTGETSYRETGFGALAYERSVFTPDFNNWPDFRTAGKPKLPAGVNRYMTAWCHGSPGIGLARLSLLQDYQDTHIREEIEVAINSTLETGFGANHSLCHGDLGNLDFLLQASRELNDKRLNTVVNSLGTSIVTGFKNRGWICSTPLQVETPGLMVGLAGIGYGLLRLAEPDKVPCLLILEPPVTT